MIIIVQWGLYEYHNVTPENAHLFHAPEDCALPGKLYKPKRQGQVNLAEPLWVAVPSSFIVDDVSGKVKVTLEYV